MTPIESKDDIRLLTILGVAMDAIETMSLEFDTDPEQLLAEYLFLTTKRIHEQGTDCYRAKLWQHYPILGNVID